MRGRDQKRLAIAGVAVVAFAAIGGTGLAASLAKPATTQSVAAGKTTLCHKQKVTITVSTSAQPAHVAHGDVVGQCAASAEKKAKAEKSAKAKAKAEAKAAKKAAKAAKEAAKTQAEST